MQASRELQQQRLLALLTRQPASGIGDLAAGLGMGVHTVHRLLRALAPQIVAAGKARRTRYAARRPVRGSFSDVSLFAIDAAGQGEQIATLVPLAPEGSWMQLPATHWPVAEAARDGWWTSLPYPLIDMRPQGYMGRQFARQEHQRLGVPANPEEWTDDDLLHALAHSGADLTGNLILGQAAYAQWLQGKLRPVVPTSEWDAPAAYADLAAVAARDGLPGSSAAGEFPKFAALRNLPGMQTPHVLVKFSGADRSGAVQRWADLLVCEHLALQSVRRLPGVASADSRLLQHAGRSFLEVERFDRHGAFGRSPLCSLYALNAALLGGALRHNWIHLCERLAARALLAPAELDKVCRIWWFGRLIANTDMHWANLSFRPQAGPSLTLAPVYDMLPMLYAPLAGGEVPERAFGADAPLPLPMERPAWLDACAAAMHFWQEAAADGRISAPFRAICRANRQHLETWAGTA